MEVWSREGGIRLGPKGVRAADLEAKNNRTGGFLGVAAARGEKKRRDGSTIHKPQVQEREHADGSRDRAPKYAEKRRVRSLEHSRGKGGA